MTDITKCPNCKSENLYCVDSRKSQGKVRRRKKCLECGFKFSTIELPMNEVYRIEKTLHLISELQSVGSLFDEIKASYKSDEEIIEEGNKSEI